MASKKKVKSSKVKPIANKVKRIPRQKPLPGMGDAKIAVIENAALDYAEIRDRRQELTTQEVDLKKRLLDLMHKEGKTEYKRNGISVSITPEGEKIKVRVRAEDDLPTPAEDVKVDTPEAEEGDF